MVLVILLLLAVAFQGTRGLWDPDEGRYTAVALQMLDSGDWWMPRLNAHREHLTKPPVTYWVLAASLGSLGRTEMAARMPNALAFVLTGWLVFLLARHLGMRRPWLAAFVWGSSLVPSLAANVVTTDTLLAFQQTLTVWLWWRLQHAERAHLGRWRLVLWLAFAVAFMIKGPPALLPLIPMVVYRWWQRPDATQPGLIDVPSAIVFLTVGLGWYVWLVSSKPELFQYFVGNEFVGRIFSDTHGRNGQWYGAIKVYLPMGLLALFPWGFYAIWICDRSRPQPWQAAFWRERCDPAGGFLWLWIALPLSVFVLAQSRLMLYVLPLAVPMSLLAARAIDRHWQTMLTLTHGVVLFAWLLVVVLIKAGTTQIESAQDARALAARINAVATNRPRTFLFVDVPARYGLRFYLGQPIEEVTAKPSGSVKPQGFRQRSLCEALGTSPQAFVLAEGRWLDRNALAAPVPRCPGFRFKSPIALSGLWLPEAVSTADSRRISNDATIRVEPQPATPSPVDHRRKPGE